MKPYLIAAAMLFAAATAPAQSLDDLNLQIHGYATQGFLYTSKNNLFTTNSSDGSAAWTQAVVNISSQPNPKLHVGIQARYYLLGNYGNKIVIDWAAIDYKFSDSFGVRVGKVKSSWGLFNEVQDIDPSYCWTLLPQSIYPTTSSNSILTHDGGVIYGATRLPPRLGKLEYRAWAGEGLYTADDGYFVAQAQAGFNLPNGIQGTLYGGALHWKTPLPGLMIGISELRGNRWSAVYTAKSEAIAGTQTLAANTQHNYFALYERNKWLVAYEYSRSWGNALSQFPGTTQSSVRNDDRGWYAMASYKVTPRLTTGFYESQNTDHQAPLGPGRYQKDFTFSSRYDLGEFLYLKAEEHVILGTGLGYDTTLNSNLRNNALLAALKLGVSF